MTIVRSCECRHSHSRNPIAARTNATHELVAVYSRHRDVGDDHTYALRLECLQRRFGRVTLKHGGTALLEQRGTRLGNALAVDHENRRSSSRTGSPVARIP